MAKEGSMKIPPSERKKAIIESYLMSPLRVGDNVFVVNERGKNESGKVVSINGYDVTIRYSDSVYGVKTVKLSEINKTTYNIGADPFSDRNNISVVNFNLDNILFNLDLLPEQKRKEEYDIDGTPIKECNFEPYVTIAGIKTYFQRPLVWSLEDKQLLIDSIYNSVSCGTILVRKREWKELENLVKNGETELSFHDVVDGKQRLTALKEFVNDGFQDSYGNFFSDLSSAAQGKFGNSHCISYTEISKATDKQILQEFLKVNFAGVPQSREHIDFVSKLYSKI